MPHPHFISRTKFYSTLVAAMLFSMHAHAVDWRECEKAKLRELQLERHTETHRVSRHKKRRSSEDRQAHAEELDTWLWKNCREFSYELRQLEQDRM